VASDSGEWATVATKKENGSAHFLQQNKLTGKFEQLVKKTSKDALVAKYRTMLAAEEKATAAEFDRAPPLGPNGKRSSRSC